MVAGAAGARPRLDKGTKLVDGCAEIPWGSGWVAKLYPDAHEATIFFRGAYDGGESRGKGSGSSTVVDPDENRARAERRARSKVRQYSASNGIDRLWTLTYAPPFCTDPRQGYDDVRRFIRRLRHRLGKPFPYVWVVEFHQDRERLHAHLGLGQYVAKPVLEELWGHGWVDARRLRVKPGSGERAKEQRAAHYLSKYVGKAMGVAADAAGGACGWHRYEVGQGFQPRSTGEVFGSESEARAWLIAQEGGEVPGFEWTSEDIDGWAGPPTRGLRW